MTELLLLSGEYGSRAYGTNTVESDRDVVRVFVEKPKYITGTYSQKVAQYSTAEEGQRSTRVDEDTAEYGLQKFAALCAQGNPSVLAVLFLGGYDYMSDLGEKLIHHRSLFVSKDSGKRFGGYMVSQRMAMTGERNKRTNRPELVHTYGYDTKFAYHVIRLGMLGNELMNTGKIKLPMRDEDVEILMKIRAGKYSKDEVLEMSKKLETELDQAIKESILPDHADRDAISKLMHEIYMEAWGE